MTPGDRELDPSIILDRKPLILYRIASEPYANLSGTGAALSPGRWNRKNEPAIYTSTEIGVPILERLVHTPKSAIPKNLALLTIQVSGNWKSPDPARLKPAVRLGLNGEELLPGRFEVFPTLDEARSKILTLSSPFAVAVPSVIVPVWNVILYPGRHGFWDHVSLVDVEPFEFDPRLFPDDVV